VQAAVPLVWCASSSLAALHCRARGSAPVRTDTSPVCPALSCVPRAVRRTPPAATERAGLQPRALMCVVPPAVVECREFSAEGQPGVCEYYNV
jgi:hypothetical protein